MLTPLFSKKINWNAFVFFIFLDFLATFFFKNTFLLLELNWTVVTERLWCTTPPNISLALQSKINADFLLLCLVLEGWFLPTIWKITCIYSLGSSGRELGISAHVEVRGWLVEANYLFQPIESLQFQAYFLHNGDGGSENAWNWLHSPKPGIHNKCLNFLGHHFKKGRNVAAYYNSHTPMLSLKNTYGFPITGQLKSSISLFIIV